jgi:hypothetical protein
MSTDTPEQTPAGRKPSHHRARILLAVLLVVAIPLIIVASIWPTFGTPCAITVGLLISVLQNVHDHPQPTDRK